MSNGSPSAFLLAVHHLNFNSIRRLALASSRSIICLTLTVQWLELYIFCINKTIALLKMAVSKTCILTFTGDTHIMNDAETNS